MGRNKHLQRDDSSYSKAGELAHHWKPSSLFTAYLDLKLLTSGKIGFLQTNLQLQKAALQVSCNTQQDMPAKSKFGHRVSGTQPSLL